MSEAAGAATGGGTGDGGAAAAAAANGASSGAGDAGAAAAAALAGAAAVAPTWYSALDKDTIGWGQNKGYFGQDLSKVDIAKVLPEVFKHDRNMESLIGKNRLPAPKDINDTEAYDAIYKALGRPADVAGYGIKLPEGGSKDYFDGMMATFHKAGLSDAQAQAIATASNELNAKVQAARTADAEATFAQQSASELAAVRTEWRGDADRNFAAAQRYAQQAGLDKPTMEKIERAIGTKAMMAWFAKSGMGLTEDRGNGQGNGGGQFVPTAEGAQSRLNDLNKDKDFIKRYQAGGAAEKQEYDKLLGIIAEAAS